MSTEAGTIFSRFKEGWNNTPLGEKAYIGVAALLVASLSADLVTTHIGLQVPGKQFTELNPFVDHIIRNFGMFGMTAVKFAGGAVILGLSENNRRLERRHFGERYFNGYLSPTLTLFLPNLITIRAVIHNLNQLLG